MVRGSRSSSTHSSQSNGSEKDYTLSVNLYGRGDADQDGDLYHVRKNDAFFYEDPVQRRPTESNTSYGRAEIKHLSNARKETAAQVLNAYGRDKSNLPQGNQNCQDWTVGALNALERERLAPQGTSAHWKKNIGQSSPDIGARLQQDGRSWVPKTTSDLKGRGPADATFGREQVRQPVGRLNLDKFASLSGSSKSRR
ncbi:hypothetical protein N7453_009847 [Penicillium expansum]|nr:hypothetical protein N7453_009847 [Penicillium expansum]